MTARDQRPSGRGLSGRRVSGRVAQGRMPQGRAARQQVVVGLVIAVVGLAAVVVAAFGVIAIAERRTALADERQRIDELRAESAALRVPESAAVDAGFVARMAPPGRTADDVRAMMYELATANDLVVDADSSAAHALVDELMLNIAAMLAAAGVDADLMPVAGALEVVGPPSGLVRFVEQMAEGFGWLWFAPVRVEFPDGEPADGRSSEEGPFNGGGSAAEISVRATVAAVALSSEVGDVDE